MHLLMRLKFMIRTYTELMQLATFEERFEYLKLNGTIGDDTFGFDRWLNQVFYNKSPEWKEVRRQVILRDNGYDLASQDRIIGGKIIVHHMNPIIIRDLRDFNPDIINPEYLISCSHATHNAIHFGDANMLVYDLVERRPNDTCPWKM